MFKTTPFFMLLCFIVLFSCAVDEDLTGTWTQEVSWNINKVIYEVRVKFIFEQESLRILYHGQDNGWVLLPSGSTRGTYTVEGNIININVSEMRIDDVWTEVTEEWTAQYDITEDTMDLIIDYDEDGEYDDSNPFDETPIGAEGPQTDILYELTKE